MRRTSAIVVLCLGSVWFLILVGLAVRWKTQHDAPLMMYIAWLMDVHGAVPYRDVLDMNLPGTYLVNLVIGRLSGYSDPGIRIGDLTILAGILGATFVAMMRFGRLVAWAAALLFGLFYLGVGPWMSLQREYLMLLPLSLAIAASSRNTGGTFRRTAFLIGLCLGCAATIKPHVLVGAPFLLGFVWRDGVPQAKRPSARRLLEISVAAGAGALIPMLLLAAYLFRSGAGHWLLEFYRGFAPIYASVNGQHQTMLGPEKAAYLLAELLRFGERRVWLLLGAVGALLVLTLRGAEKRFVGLLGALLVAYSVYVALQGRFFDYHWLIAHYIALLLASLCFVERPDLWPGRPLLGLAPGAALAFLAWVALPVHADLRSQLRGETLAPPKKGRPDKVAAFLKERLRPGDLVQPLDITGGAVHGMLLARADLATPFLYDAYFYIGVSNPFVQELRRRFIEGMNERRPRFVVDVYGEDKPWVRGPDTTREFPELRALLDRDYAPVAEAEGTIIYERRPPPGAPPSP